MSTKSLSQVVSRVRQRLRRGQTPQQQPPDLCRWSSYMDPFPPITFGGYRRYYETHGKPNPKLFPIPECYLTPAVADLHAAGGNAVGRAATAAAGAGKSVEKVVVGSPRTLDKTKTPSRSSTSASGKSVGQSEQGAAEAEVQVRQRTTRKRAGVKSKRTLSTIREGGSLRSMPSRTESEESEDSSSGSVCSHGRSIRTTTTTAATIATRTPSLRHRQRRLLRTASIERDFHSSGISSSLHSPQQPSSDSSFSSSPSDESAFSHWTTRTETTATPPPTEGSCEERDDDSEKRLSGSLRRLQLGESDWRESVSSYCTAPTHFEDDDDI